MMLARRTRRAAVVLIPLLAAAAWAASWTPTSYDGGMTSLRSRDIGLWPASPPDPDSTRDFSVALAVEQAGRSGWLLAVGAVLVLSGFVAGNLVLARRARLSRRVRRLSMRFGLLSLLLGVAAAALLAAGAEIVDRELGFRSERVASDRASTPWGAVGVALVGVALGLLGCAESWTLGWIDRLRGRHPGSRPGGVS